MNRREQCPAQSSLLDLAKLRDGHDLTSSVLPSTCGHSFPTASLQLDTMRFGGSTGPKTTRNSPRGAGSM